LGTPAPSARGRFITFEGGEGAGKSTQVALLHDRLAAAGCDVVVTREPGGSPGAEHIRRLLVDGEPGRWDAVTEALLHNAARRDHLRTVVWPALAAGRWVLSDRFADSTMAYQGYGHRLGRRVCATLYRAVGGDFAPDLTLILDVPVEVGLVRAKHRAAGEDRYERMDTAFHGRVRRGYLDIARREPTRCAVIDAHGTETEVHAAVMHVVAERTGLTFE
jgi:dTMP kinase